MQLWQKGKTWWNRKRLSVSRMLFAILLFQIFKCIFLPNPVDWFITFLLGFFYLAILFRLV